MFERAICFCKGEWRECEHLGACKDACWVGESAAGGYSLYKPIGESCILKEEIEYQKNLEKIKKEDKHD